VTLSTAVLEREVTLPQKGLREKALARARVLLAPRRFVLLQFLFTIAR
jgi:hypothetical protein